MLIYNNLNAMTLGICKSLLIEGNKIPSRNGMTFEHCDVEIKLNNPQNRHLYLEGRKNNIYACFAEIFWILSGKNEIDPLMNFFLPRAVNFSDDGKTWQNGYGPKLYESGNVQNVIQSFLSDGKLTRRAVMAIWTPQTDTIHSLNELGITKPKDVSCNNFLWFWIRDNKLNLKVGVRSNDVLWGLSAINVPEWTVLQELVLQILKNSSEEFKDVELGYYHHSVISLHIYDETAKQAVDMTDNTNMVVNFDRVHYNYDNYPILLSNKISIDKMKVFFGQLYESFCNNIINLDYYARVDSLFKEWGIPTEGNQLYNYASMVESYIDDKLNNSFKKPLDLSILSEDLKEAVLVNKFTPKSWLGK